MLSHQIQDFIDVVWAVDIRPSQWLKVSVVGKAVFHLEEYPSDKLLKLCPNEDNQVFKEWKSRRRTFEVQMHHDFLEDSLLRTLPVLPLIHKATDSGFRFFDFLVLLLLDVDLGVLLDCFADVHEAILIGYLKGCLAVKLIEGLDLDPSLQQELNNLKVLLPHCQMQQSIAAVVLIIDDHPALSCRNDF